MSEAVIARRGKAPSARTTSLLIATSSLFTAPVSTTYDVTAIGAGSGNNGLNGDVNSKSVYLNENDTVEVTIGTGGDGNGGTGGTTSFGNYVAATGGVSDQVIDYMNFGMSGIDDGAGQNGAVVVNYIGGGSNG